jgi:hypothetical protein
MGVGCVAVADTVAFVDDVELDGLLLSPGAELAGTLEALIPFAMQDSELVDALVAFRRQASWAQAGELAVIAELARRRPAGAYERLANGSSYTGEFVIDEVETALTLSGTSAAYLVEMALAIDERLPATGEALRAGLIDYAKAKVIAQGTSATTREIAELVERQVLDAAPGQTTSQLRAKVARAVMAADPEAAERRRKTAEAQRDVHCHEERDGSGTATIAGRNLPADQAVAAVNRLNAIARAFKADGDTRRLGAIRADVLLAMMLGLLPAQPPSGDEAASVPDAQAASGRAGQRGCPAGCTDAQTTSSQAYHGYPAAGRIDDEPVEHGGIADLSRSDQDIPPPPERPDDLGGDASEGPDHSQAQPWYLTPAQDRDQDPYEEGDDAPARRETDIAARAGARVGTVNLTIPLTTYLGLTHTPAEVAGYGPLLAEVARILADNATQPGAEWCVTVLDDHGHPIQHGEIRYRPSPALRRKIEVRNPTCVFPQCRRPTRACDLDHTIPFGQDGGITCACNVAPLCRRHHRLKQADGWRLDQIEPGHYMWTTPSGKRYHSIPEEQPL